MAARIVMIAGVVAVAAALVFPDAALVVAQKAGYTVCHQWPEHSFVVAGIVFPMCARCTGMYTGAIAALAFIWFARRSKAGDWPPKTALVILGVGFGLMAADGLNSFADALSGGTTHLYPPSNALRFITGWFNGLAIVSIGYPLLCYLLWNNWEGKPVLNSAKETLALGASAFAVLLLVQNVSALAPVFWLLGLFGILLLFTGINMALWVILMRKERRANHLREALPAIAAGICMALVELMAIGLSRAALLGVLQRPT